MPSYDRAALFLVVNPVRLAFQLRGKVFEYRPIGPLERLWPSCDSLCARPVTFGIRSRPLDQCSLRCDALLALTDMGSDLGAGAPTPSRGPNRPLRSWASAKLPSSSAASPIRNRASVFAMALDWHGTAALANVRNGWKADISRRYEWRSLVAHKAGELRG